MGRSARNPWLALDVNADPVAHARRLRRAHERGFLAEDPNPGDVRALVLASWRRSLAAGVMRESAGAPVGLDSDALAAARDGSPLAPVAEVIFSTLSELDADARHVIAIGDAEANLLWVRGEPDACERAREMGFAAGAAWSEAAAGTNAVGTAAALDHPVQIFSAEHLIAAVHPWTCSGAPIHEPTSGELIGVVDVTAELRTHHPHTLSLAALAARAAETALQLRAFAVIERLRSKWEAVTLGRRSPSALLDAYGRVIACRGVSGLPSRIDAAGAKAGPITLPDERVGELQPLEDGGAILWLCRRPRRRSPRLKLHLLGHGPRARAGSGPEERGLRSLELLAVLAMHPDGLTAEQLALALYGERGKPVTIRAQVHRVRTFLGEGVLHTQPYRLAGPVDADWLEVGRLVSEGRPGAALNAYPGPLLPASDAPAIVEARGLLEESLRCSILTTADGDLLSRWLAHPAGADDVAAARALVAVLPSGGSRRAAATAIAAAIGRRIALPS